MKDLSDILLKRLYFLCSLTFNSQARLMMLLGQGSAKEPDKVWAKLEDNLLGGEWTDLLETYPVLAKRIGVTTEYFLTFVEEFLDRFNGKKEILSLEIKPEVVDPDDIETLSDVLCAAFNEAIKKVEETNKKEMAQITGDINVPGIF
jgi:lantibiotic modifying enzyme